MADPRKFFAALESMHPAGPAAIEQLHTALERLPVTVQHLKKAPMHLVQSVLTPPIVDPTRPPRRIEGPRLRVRTVDAYSLSLPRTDSRNRFSANGRRPRLWCAEWEIWLIDEHGQERLLEWTDSGDQALAALPRLLRELGFLNEDGTRPAAEGGASDAA